VTALERVTVALWTEDPLLATLWEPDELPDDLTVPTEIALIPQEAALLRDLPPGEKASATVLDRLGERGLLVMAEAPGQYVAAEIPELTELLARRLRATSSATGTP
jgi:hypothetical protein